MSKKKILSIEVDTGSYASFVDGISALARGQGSYYVCVANVHMVMEAYRDKDFAAIVNGADVVTPDGTPVAKSMLLLHGVQQNRVAGMDLVPDIIAAAERDALSIYFYGSTEHVLQAVLNRISQEHPRLKVAGCYSPPFRALTAAEDAVARARINASGANIVLVALGCPKQEKWMAANRGSINAVMVGIGGALPVYARIQRRAPLIMQRLALEWLYRLCQEPRRLFKRYLVTNTTFLFLLALEMITTRLKRECGLGLKL